MTATVWERSPTERLAAERDLMAYRHGGFWQSMAEAAAGFMRESTVLKYSYNIGWLSRLIIQYPQGIVAMQELIWSARPNPIIETGIAHGGSAVFSVSMLALLDYCDAPAAGEILDPAAPRRRVLAVDIDIRAQNRALIEAHPLTNRIDLVEGSSVDDAVVARARTAAVRAGRFYCVSTRTTLPITCGANSKPMRR